MLLFVPLVQSLRRQAVEHRRTWMEWQWQMHKWEALYYCHRCDGVFPPGLPLFVPTSATRTLLAQP